MVLKKIMGIFAITLLVGAASFATAGVPDLNLSTATSASGGTTVVMFNLPNGGGDAFADATGGSAVISLTLVDGLGAVIANFPAEDMWLESVDGALLACGGGTVADFNSNAAGETSWVAPMQAMGASEAGTLVMISGTALVAPALAISHNSADVNGDGAVSLPDVSLFAGDLNGGLNPFRSDFKYDGLVSLPDVSKLAGGLGASCP